MSHPRLSKAPHHTHIKQECYYLSSNPLKKGFSSDFLDWMIESQDSLMRLENAGVLSENQIILLSNAREKWLSERKPTQMLLEGTSNSGSIIFKKLLRV